MTQRPDNNILPPTRVKQLGRLSIPVVWAAAICWLSLIPSPPSPPGILGWDKLLHAVAYALLALAVAQYLLIHCADSRRAAIYAALLAIAYGALLEILQHLMQNGRTAEWWDLAADVVGAVAGGVLFCQVATLFSPNHARNRAHG